MSEQGHDLRLLPLAVAAWAGAWLGTAGLRPEPGLLFSVFASLGIGVVLAARARRHWSLLVLVVLAATVLLSGAREVQLHTSLPAQLADEGVSAQVRLRVIGDARLVDQGPRPVLVVVGAVLLEVRTTQEAVGTSQQVVVFASGDTGEALAGVAPGSVVEVRGSLAPAEPASADALVVRARELEGVVASPGPVDSLVNHLRSGLRQAASHSPPQQAALVPSLVVGDTSGITQDMTADFEATSLSHLLAVSGANLTLMLTVVLGVARAVGVRGWAVRGVAVVCVVLFVLVCRSEPSVVRAAAMGLVSLSAVGLGRGRRSMRHLGLAVLCLMLVDPWLSRSWGFALSVAACCGISLLAPVWTRTMSRWLARPLAEALTIPLAAQLATQPLITALSGQVSVVGVLANVAAGPFVGPATTLGLAATCLVFFPSAAAVLAWLAGWCVQPILWVAQIGAGLPAASLAWPADALGLCLCVVACVLVAVLVGQLVGTPLGALVMVAVMVLGSLTRPVPLGWPGAWAAVFCDVGQGDATVLRAAPTAAVVVDAGPDPGPVQSCLDSLGVEAVPLLVLTHYHSDHVGGAEALIARYQPEVVLVSPLASPSRAAAAVADAAAAAGARLTVAIPGTVLQIGQVTWTTVAARDSGRVFDAAAGENAEENDASVAGLVEVDGLRVLLPGDLEPAGQRRALAEARQQELSLQAHVLKLPHHGSSRQDEDFFEATGASLAVVSAGRDNDYGHPADAALDLARGAGMAVVRTDEDGAVAVILEGDHLGIRTAGAAGADG